MRRHSLILEQIKSKIKLMFVEQLKKNYPKTNTEIINFFSSLEMTWLSNPICEQNKNIETNRIEIDLIDFLKNPNESVHSSFCSEIRDVLENNMILHELEEARGVYLRYLATKIDFKKMNSILCLIETHDWLWTLKNEYCTGLSADEKKRRLLLKYELFHQIGWLTNPTRSNQVVQFQLWYVENSDSSILDILKEDMKIEIGSEIFQRIRTSNPFIVSAIYNLFKTNSLHQIQ
jgi:hypothetical protein